MPMRVRPRSILLSHFEHEEHGTYQLTITSELLVRFFLPIDHDTCLSKDVLGPLVTSVLVALLAPFPVQTCFDRGILT